MIRADLHVHTYYSDGLMSPAEVVTEAARKGLNALAVTDHDCMLACPEVFTLCKQKGIKAISGIEVSAYENGVKIHTLGYNLNAESADFRQFYKRLYDGSIKRTEDILYKLNKLGVRLTIDDILKQRTSPLSPIHAMHVARAGAEKGYKNTPFSFYTEYLAFGKSAFSEICRPSPEEAIEVINASGGFASLAHPARIELEKDGLLHLIRKLKACGLCGIEGVYSTHTVNETAYYKETAKAFNLLVTGGSDTHIKGGGKEIGTPAFFIDEALADKLGI